MCISRHCWFEIMAYILDDDTVADLSDLDKMDVFSNE